MECLIKNGSLLRLAFAGLLVIGFHGVAQAQFSGGDGSSGDPYIIENVDHLENIPNEDGEDVYFELANSINLQDVDWDPIDDFEGNFDGSYHTISNLTIEEGGDNLGLFASVAETGLVENLVLENIDIEGENNFGGVAGISHGEMQNVSVTGSIIGDLNVGGAIGRNYGEIEQIITDVTVEAGGGGNRDNFGGMVGRNSGTIQSSASLGNVESPDAIGGFVGHNDTNGNITTSYSSGAVTEVSPGGQYDERDGGFAGLNDGSITDSYWDQEVNDEFDAIGEDNGTSDLTGLDTNEMTGDDAEDNMEALDFDNIWNLDDSGYPNLAWQTESDSFPATLTGPDETTAIPFNVDVEFGDDVTSFDEDDIEVTNGDVQNVTGADSDWTVEISPTDETGSEDVIIEIEADQVFNDDGDGNEASNELTVTHNPVELTLTGPGTTTAIPFEVQADFSEDIDELLDSQIEVTNGTVANIDGEDQNWVIEIEPINADISEDVTVEIEAGDVEAQNGGLNEQAEETITHEPVTLTLDGPDETSSDPFEVEAVFGEDIDDFDVNQIDVNGGDIQETLPDGSDTRILRINPDDLTQEEDITITFPAETFEADNGGINAEDDITVTYTPITAELDGPEGTSDDPFEVDLEFSEDVDEVDEDQITVINGELESAANNDPDQWTLTISPDEESGETVEITVEAGAATGTDGGSNEASNQLEVYHDSTPFEAEIISDEGGETAIEPFGVTIEFNKEYDDFELSYLDDDNVDTYSNLDTSEPDEVSFDVQPEDDGPVEIILPAANIEDEAGNILENDAVLEVEFNGSDPEVEEFEALTGDPTNEESIEFSLEFTKPVENVDEDVFDIQTRVDEISVSGEDEAYTIEVTPEEDGLIEIGFSAGEVEDDAGNTNPEEETASITYNTSTPTVTDFETNPDEPTNQSDIDFEITFSEDIPELDEDDFTLSDNIIDPDLTGGGTDYTLSVEAIADGEVEATLEEGAFQDAAGNESEQEYSASVEFNETAPTAEIEALEDSPTNADDIEFEITFSEDIPDLDEGDFTLTNTTGATLTGGGDTYTLEVQPDQDGDVIVELEEGSFEDEFGNENTEEASASVESDRTPPEVDEIVKLSSDPTNEEPIEFILRFDEPVVDFDSGNINERQNVQSIDLSGSDDEYTLEVYPSGQGDVTVGFDGTGGFEDEAGNENTTADETSTITFNSTAPVVDVFNVVQTSPTSADEIEFEIEFSEEIPDLLASDFDLSRAQNPSLDTSDDINYTLTVEPTTDGEVSAELPVGSFEDAAGNENEEAFSASVEYDGTRPYVESFEPVQDDPTNETQVEFELEFSEPIEGLEADDFELGSNFDNAVILSGADGDTEFEIRVDVTATGEDLVEVVLPENTYQDEAGNEGESASGSITYDEVPPEIVELELASWITEPTGRDPFEVKLEFDKEISGFDEMELTVNGGAAPVGYSSSDNKTFYVEISPNDPDSDADIEVIAEAGDFEDLAGNVNQDTESVEVEYQGDIPTVEVEGPERDATNQDVFTVDLEFSEEVEGLTEDGLTVINAVVDDIDPDDTTPTEDYTVTLLVNTQPENEIAFQVDEGAAESTDNGTGNEESDPLFIWFDNTDLTAEFSTEESDPTDAPEFEVDLEFNKDEIYEFDPLTDLDADNADIAEVDEVTEYIYTITLEPEQQGDVTLTLPQGAAEDRAGNENEEEVFEIFFEEDPPEVVSIERGPGIDDPTNENPFEIEIEFSKEIDDFYEDGLQVINASATDFETDDDITFLVEITPDEPDEETQIEVGVPAGVYEDLAGNSNLQDEENFSIIYNGTELTVELEGPELDSTNEDPFEVDIIFSEPTYDFTGNDIFTNNGDVLALEGNEGDEEFTATIRPDDGDEVSVDIQINSGVAEDEAGNENLSSELLTVLYDETPFTAEFSTDEDDPTTSDEFEVAIEFNKDAVEDFDNEDLIVDNGDVSDLERQGDAEFTFTLEPDDFGMVEVTLPEGVTEDPATNPNEEANFEIEYAPDRPQVIAVETGQNTNDPTSLDPFYINIEFDRDIDVFDESGIDDADGIVVDNGEVVGGGQITSGNDRLFEVEISPNGEGEVTIEEIPQGVAVTDGIENELWEEEFTIVYDPNRPTVERIDPGPDVTDPTGDNPFQVEIEFSEEIANFDEDELDVYPDAEATGFQTEDNQTFIVDIAPQDDGGQYDIFVEVPEGVFEDPAGNLNMEDAEDFSIFYDGIAPAVTEFIGPENDATRFETFDVEIVFNDDIDNFDGDGIQIDNGDLQALTRQDSDRFNAVIDVDRGVNDDAEEVWVSMFLEYDAAQNEDGVGSLESHEVEYLYDVTEFTAEFSTTEDDPTAADQIPVELEFNKEVYNLEASDLNVTNASLINFTNQGDGLVTFELVPDEDGEVIVELPEGVAEDAAGNDNPEAVFEIVSSQDPPEVVEFYPVPDDPTNEAEIEFEIIFNEPIVNLSLTDFETTNADKRSLDGDEDQYTITVEAQSEGLVEVVLPEDRYNDEAGNRNDSSADANIMYDITRPTVVDITPADGYDDPTNQNPFEVDIEFSEEIVDFDEAELVVDQAEATDWESNDNITFTVEITPDDPDEDAVIEVSVPENVYTDQAGNLNEEDNIDFDITYRGTSPIVEELNGPENDATNDDPFFVEIVFSEDVENFDTSGFDITNATVISVVEDGQPDRYIAEIEPDNGDQFDITLFVVEGAAQNAAGNDNEESDELEILYDLTDFTAEMTSDEDDPTRSEDFEVTLTFNKDAYEFDQQDLQADLADIIDFDPVSDQEYTITLEPTDDGIVTLTLPEGGALDAAGNEVEEEVFEIEADQTAPFVTDFEPVQDDPTNEAEIDFEITFNQPINGLEIDDFELVNAFDVDLTGSDDFYTLTVEADEDGEVEITLPAGTYEDDAGNVSLQEASATIEYDSTPPVVDSFEPVQDDPTNADQIEFEVTFNEEIEELVLTDFEPDNANLYDLNGSGDEYILTVEPIDDDIVEVVLPDDTYRDIAGNWNEEPASASIEYDSTPPEVVEFEPVPEDPTSEAEIDFELTFSEPIENLDAGDFDLTNAEDPELDGEDDSYTLTVTAIDDGDVIVELPANRYDDLAGNRNDEPASASIEFNGSAPEVVEFEPVNDDPTNQSEIEFELTFSEPVEELRIDDFEIDNGFRIDLEGTGDTRTLTIEAANEGTVTATLPAETFEDAAGNQNNSSAESSIEYDITPPEIVEFEVVGDDPTSSAFIEFELILSDPTEELDIGDFQFVNADPQNLTGEEDEYTLLVEAQDDGLVEVTLPEDSFNDDADNWNEDSETATVYYDNIPPFVEEFEALPEDPTNEAEIDFELTFSEPVFDFDVDDFDLENAEDPELEEDDGEYSLTVTAIDDGDVIVTLPADRYEDEAGNRNQEPASASITYDETAPFVEEFTTVNDDPTNDSEIIFELTFSEPVEDLRLNDFEETNVFRVDLQGDGDTRTLIVEAANEGIVELELPEDTYEDAAGNRNTEEASASIYYDNTPPTVEVFEPVPEDPTEMAFIEFDLEFSELVTDLDADDFEVVNGTPVNILPEDALDDEFTLLVEAEEGGLVEVTLPEDSHEDEAGNRNEEEASASITFDDEAPRVVEFEPVQDDPTNADEIEFELTFSEEVFDLELDDFDLTNADEIDLSGEGENYTLTISAVDEGTVRATLPNDSYEDEAGNRNVETASSEIEYDITPPELITFEPVQDDPTNESTIQFELVFSEPIKDLSIGDFEVENALSNELDGSDDEFTLEVEAIDDGEVIAELPADVYTDLAGNANEDDEVASIIYDQTPPEVVSFEPMDDDPTNDRDISFEITFSESVEDLEADDFDPDNATVQNLSGNEDQFIVDVEAINEGEVSITLPDDSYEDLAGNRNEDTNTASIVFDDTPPIVLTFDPVQDDPTNADEIEFEITFSEPVVDLELDDFDLIDASGLELEGEDEDYLLTIQPEEEGQIEAHLPVDTHEDLAGNRNTDPASASITYDITPPQVVEFEAIGDDPTNEAEIEFEITFSKDIVELELDDFELTNATAEDLSGADDEFVLTVNALTDGDVVAELHEDAYRDIAGNYNDESASASIEYDASRPYVDVIEPTLETGDPTSDDPFEVNISFNQEIVDFDESELEVTNGQAVGFESDDDIVFTVEIEPDEPDELLTVEVGVPENVFTDVAGNENLADEEDFSIVYDGVAPLATLIGPEHNATNEDPFEITVEFSKDVSGLDQDGFILSHGEVIDVEEDGSPDQYIAKIEPPNEDEIDISIILGSGAAQDEAGNDNETSDELVVTYDLTPFTVELSSDEDVLTNADEFDVFIEFNKPAFELESDDFFLENAVINEFEQTADEEFVIEISPQENGEVTVEVPFGSAWDPAGNLNEAGDFEIIFDQTPPEVVEFEAVDDDPTNNTEIDFEIVFSAPVEDLSIQDFEFTNSNPEELEGEDDTYILTVEPQQDGLVEITLPEDSYENAAGNRNEESATASITYDGTNPVVEAINPADGFSDPTNEDPFEVEISFSEAIADFDDEELELTNAETSGFSTEDDITFLVDVVPEDPEGEAEISVDVPEAVYHDLAGNPNEEVEEDFTITYDNIDPVVTLIGPEYNSTNQNPFEVEVMLSEPVVSFDESDFFILNGTVTDLEQGGSELEYTATVEPDEAEDIVVSMQVNSGVLEDEAGNTNEASNNLNIRYDETPLTVELTSDEDDPSHNDPLEVTAQFNKTVFDFDESSMILTNVESVDIEDEEDGEFTLWVSPEEFGDVKVEIPEEAVEDPSGNLNENSDSFEVEYTPERPEVVRLERGEDIGDPTNEDPFQIELEFDLDINLFREGEIEIENGSVSGDVTADNDRQFIIDITPDSDGEVIIAIPEGVAFTGEGGENRAYEEELIVTFDGSQPEVTFATDQEDPTRSREFTVSIMFSERVFGLDRQDLETDNAQIINFSDAASDSVSVRLEPETDGEVRLTVPEGIAEDEAGNPNAEGVFTIEYNSSPVMVELLDPDDEFDEVPVEAEFEWESAQRANTYQLQIAETDEFSDAVMVKDVDDIEENEYQVGSELRFERTYFWRVRGINTEGTTGEWSDIWTFTTVKELPPQVSLDFPENEEEEIELQPEFDWLSADRALSYEIQISKDATFNDDVIEQTGITGTDYELDENLEDDQVYFWRVRGANDAGEGEWSEIYSFETILRPPGEVVLETPTDSTGSVSLEPELVWNEAERADSYRIQIAEDANFDLPDLVIEDVEDLEYAIEEELDWFATYDWRVQGVNETDAGEWSERGTFISKAEPPEQTYPESGKVSVSTAPVLNWTSNHNDVNFEFRISNDDELENIVESGVTDTTEVILTGLEDARTHYWQVRVIDEMTTSDWSEIKVFSTRADPGGQEFTNTIRFVASGDENLEIIPEDSRLIGLPGSDNIMLDQVIEGNYFSDWRAFHDTGEEEDYFIEFDAEEDSLEFGDGAAYWVVHRDAVSIDEELRPVIPTEIDAYPIDLHAGWNIITTPYFSTVDWDLVRIFNTHTLEYYDEEPIPAEVNELQLYGYSSLFIDAEEMRPMHGYYFYNDPEWEVEQLYIPFTDHDVRGIENPDIEDLIDEESGTIELEAELADEASTDSLNYRTSVDFIFNAGNPDGYSAMHPDLDQSHYGMAISEEDGGNRSSLKRSTGTTYNEEGTKYDLEVKAPVGKKMNWTASFTEMGDQTRVLLVNPVTNKSQMLENGQQAEIRITEPEVTYEVYVGDKSYLKEIEEDLLPDQITLKDNYPNPFNATTTLRYALVEDETVRLDVFDILGRRVQTLVDGEQQNQGWHTAEFDGTGLASGTYLYRLVVGNEVKSGKMMLVK